MSGKGKSSKERGRSGGPGSRGKGPGPGGLVRAGGVAQQPLPWRDTRERRLQEAEPSLPEFLVVLKPAEGVGAAQGGMHACVW